MLTSIRIGQKSRIFYTALVFNAPVETFSVRISPRYLVGEQELSYRKQVARQPRTQYVEGIHRPKYYTVTLKSRLRVTQGHWKRNHWTDHTRLTISRVI